MSDHWDVIVVGSGLGGLTAAANLARRGTKVLVLDRNPHPGGTAYTFVRKGYRFPMGPLGVSSPDLIRHALEQAGADPRVEFSPVRYQVRAFGLEVGISEGPDRLAAELKKFFPGEGEGIERFFAEMDQLDQALQDPAAHRDLLTARSAVATGDFLDGLVRDRGLWRILGSQGTHEPYSSVVLTAAMWALISRIGIWLPAGGVKELADRLVRALTDRGGELRLSASVERIVVEHGRASGVILADGTRLTAGSVISNADYKATFTGMVEESASPPEFLEAVQSARQTGSVLQVSLGVDRSRVDLSAFGRASRILYRRAGSEDAPAPEWSRPKIDPASLAAQELEISGWSVAGEAMAPPDGAAVVIRVEADYGHFARFWRGWRRRLPEYGAYKERLARALVREAWQVLPGLGEAVRVMDVSTPLTFHDQGGRTSGAVAGWSWDYGDDQDWRPRDLTITPVEKLYMAGYQARSALFAGGVPTAMASGLDAARAVTEDRPAAREVLIPAPKQS